MPTYTYKCTGCEGIQEEFHGIKEEPKVLCAACGELAKKSFSSNVGGFYLRGMTPSKAWKEKRLRHRKSAELGVKQIERWGSGPKLRPNVAGEEHDSWEDAKSVASEAGISTDSFDEMIANEKRTDNCANVDETKWKVAKEELRKS